MTHQETELKLALESEADYALVRGRLPGFEGEYEQENRYYDLSGGPLEMAKVMWRLRRSASGFTLTVKRKAIARDGYFEAEEHEEALPEAAGVAVFADPANWCRIESAVLAALREQFGALESVVCWGRMINRRRCYRLRDDVVVELDQTEFGRHDHEWEIEVEHGDPAAVRALLEPHLIGVRYVPQARTKAQRLQARLAKKRGPA